MPNKILLRDGLFSNGYLRMFSCMDDKILQSYSTISPLAILMLNLNSYVLPEAGR
jgi:hypothetical protein